MKPQVALLGTGLMGEPMGQNLLRAGFSLRVWNRTREKTTSLAQNGAQVCESPAEASQNAAYIISVVTDGPDVEAVLFGADGAAQNAPKNAILVDMSTIAPAKAIEFSERAKSLGLRFLEAPVTGGTVGAQKGTLSILAAGDEADFEEARPVFEAMGQTLTFCGPAGSGQGVKLCNQIMGALNLLGVCEALVLAQKMGLDGEILVKALSGGAATSWALQNLAPKIANGDFAPGFMIDTQQKDMRLVSEAAENAGVSLPGAALTQQLWRACQARGDGSNGIQGLYKVLAELANLGRD